MALVVSFIILTLLGRVQELIPPLAYLKPVMLAMLIGGVSLLIYYPYGSVGRPPRRPTIFWLLTSIGFAASIPMSLYMSKSVEFLALTYLCTSFLFLLVSQCVRRLETLEAMAFSLLLVSLLLGIGILVNPRRLVTDTGFRYSVSDTYDSNDLALVFAMGIPFVFYWFWRGGVVMKLLAVLSALVAVYGIHLTGSRGGLIALATVIVYMVLRIKEIGPIIRGLLVAAMLLGAALATQTDTFQQLILAAKGQDYNTTAEDGRLQVWRRGLGYIATHPLTGVGIVCFEEAEGKLSGRSTTARGIRWTAAHNSYIQVCAENGIPTFIFWLGMIFSSLAELRRQRRILEPLSDDPMIHRVLVLRGMVQTSLVAYVVGAFFLSLGYLAYLYLLVGMTVALAEITDQIAADAHDEHAGAELAEKEDEQVLAEAVPGGAH